MLSSGDPGRKYKKTFEADLGGFLSFQRWSLILINLESERNKFLKSQEDLWRLKSRAIWVQSGDKNTKFFHQFANHQRINKHLWEIKDDLGHLHKGQKSIVVEAENYFKSFFNSSDLFQQ
jgi:hypothetical protein